MASRRASATVVVATVFLVDRLVKRLVVAPGKWTAAVCNALAALLCHLVAAISFPMFSGIFGDFWLMVG